MLGKKVGTSGKEDSARLSKLDSTLTAVFFDENFFCVEWMSSKLLQAFGGVFFDFWPKTIYRLSKLRFYLSCHTSSGEIFFPGKVNSLLFFPEVELKMFQNFWGKTGWWQKIIRTVDKKWKLVKFWQENCHSLVRNAFYLSRGRFSGRKVLLEKNNLFVNYF